MLSKRAGYPFFCVIGFFFVFCWKTEKDLAELGNLLWTAEYTLKTLALSAVCGGALGCAAAFLLYGRAEGKWRRKHIGSDTGEAVGKFPGFWLSLALILLAWLPVYLAYYPGICAYDAPVQTGQAAENYMVDHHPIAHTLLIKGAMSLGRDLFGNVNTGIALYTALQMIFLAAAMAYGMKALRRFGVKTGWRLLTLFGCMAYPFHWYMSVSMTKDTVFSAFLLLQLVSLSEILLENRQTGRLSGREWLFSVSTVGMILFRNNGKYAMAVLLLVLLLTVWRGKKSRKLWTRLFLCCAAAFLAGNLCLSALFRATSAEQGDRREMLSLPIQQLARCMIYHGGVGVLPEDDNTMEEADKALINDFLLDNSYAEYEPGIADPVKRHTNTYVVRYRTGDFIRTYLHLFSRYPGDFINAALALDAGFLSPGDVSHAYVNMREGSSNLGYVQTRWEEETLNSRGISKDSKWKGLYDRLERWADENGYLNWPVLKYLFVPGSFLWFYLLLFGDLLINRRFRMCLPLSLIGGYYGTMLLGPTVQMRYLYPVMAVLPFLVLLCGRAESRAANGAPAMAAEETANGAAGH